MTEPNCPTSIASNCRAQVDEAAATWTAGAKFFGELARGPGRDPSVARDAAPEQD